MRRPKLTSIKKSTRSLTTTEKNSHSSPKTSSIYRKRANPTRIRKRPQLCSVRRSRRFSILPAISIVKTTKVRSSSRNCSKWRTPKTSKKMIGKTQCFSKNLRKSRLWHNKSGSRTTASKIRALVETRSSRWFVMSCRISKTTKTIAKRPRATTMKSQQYSGPTKRSSLFPGSSHLISFCSEQYQ